MGQSLDREGSCLEMKLGGKGTGQEWPDEKKLDMKGARQQQA